LGAVSTTTSTTSDPASGAPSKRPAVRAREVARTVWPQVALLLAALLWWPVGFLGVAPWLHLPLSVFDGDVLFLGATAAAASASLLVRSPWPRFAIVVVFSGLGWLLDAPAKDDYPHERVALAALLVAAALVGILLGARGSKGPVAAGTVVVMVAGLSPASWPTEAAVAVALALPFAVATWQRVAPTVLGVVRLALTWLLFALLARALSYGWDVLRPGTGGGLTLWQLARRVAEPAVDFVRTQWWTWSEIRLQQLVPWLWLTAVSAVVLVAGRVALAEVVAARRRKAAALDGEPTSRWK
jgi:hypothetical protein